jgi:hypothetical protein
MRRRDHPQIGDLWANSDSSSVFIVLEKTFCKECNDWELIVLLNGEKRTVYYDKDFKKLDGQYWKLT